MVPEKLPLLIARQDVFFPKTKGSLELGREASLNAVYTSLKHFGGHIAIVTQRRPDDDNPAPADIFEVGIVAQVEIVRKNKDESLKVEVRGMYRAKVIKPAYSYYKGDLHLGQCWYAETFGLRDKPYNYSETKDSISSFLDNLPAIIPQNNSTIRELRESLNQEHAPLDYIVDALANLWPRDNMNALQLKQEILEETSLVRRIEILKSAEYVSDDLRDELENLITKRVGRNISKQQREFYLREKLKVIREELGDSASRENEAARFREKLAKSDSLPEAVKTRLNEEIIKFEGTSSYSNESMIIRNYIDWIFSMPWGESTESERDLNRIKDSLEFSHKGLEKIKDRILEFIAVQNKSNNPKGSIICFVGPPGVGKTSLAQAIANSLNKRFAKISLGGMNDESELRGHRRTYVAAMPGRIIRALRNVKTNNPVILLDEIDKLSVNYHGDPVNVLLEVLDPKQNHQFSDHFLELEFDLSKVMFIATANYEEDIPEPLHNRMEIIRIGSYSEGEKFDIARSHLIPEVLREHGLTDVELTFQDEAVHYVIQRYTKEAGLRSLKRMLSKIARKFVRRQSLGEMESEDIGVEQVKHYLEYELYDFTVRDESVIPGIVNGMAYTDYGGDLLPVEVNHMIGKGNLSLTGNLKDTMKESASVAVAFVRANDKRFRIDGDLDWGNLDINLHVPSGGVPKDGPSAGVTITTALISSLTNRPVPTNIAMTGEITLRGKVLPIGGLKEKIMSAVRGGIDTIFLPHENQRHLSNVPEEVREKVKLIPVKEYSEIYSYIFEEGKVASI